MTLKDMESTILTKKKIYRPGRDTNSSYVFYKILINIEAMSRICRSGLWPGAVL
jgi:hypothetical protein